MKMTLGQKAAAWAVVQALFAGCSADTGFHSPSASPPPPPPTPAPAPVPTPAPVAPTIGAQPTDATVLTGATPIFSVSAKGNNLSYQWKKNGTAIAGATSSSYQVPAAIWSDDGAQYVVVVSNSVGSVTSNAATEHLQLSADQQAYESFILSPAAGSYEAMWSLNLSGAPSTGDYFAYDYAVLAETPLTKGPQTTQQQAPVNLSASLSLPTSGVTRVLKNGAVLIVPGTQNTVVTTYVGSSIQADDLATDNKTVAYSQLRSNYTVESLSGPMNSTPAEFAQPYNAIFQNPTTLKPTATWASGAAYLRFTAKNVGDRYDVADCTINTVTTGTTPNPCQTGTTLSAAMAAGETSSSDGTTYHTADGVTVIVAGVNIWIANAVRPISATGTFTTEHRIYYELNGNVYTGHLIKDGTVIGGGHYRSVISDPTTEKYFDYNVRMNGAAAQSLVAGSAI